MYTHTYVHEYGYEFSYVHHYSRKDHSHKKAKDLKLFNFSLFDFSIFFFFVCTPFFRLLGSVLYDELNKFDCYYAVATILT